jgi:nitrogen fixation NifU-like protein
MSEPLDDLYRDILMEHFRYPRGRNKLEHVHLHNEGQNPVCGDEIEIALELEGEKVKDIYVSCMGCAISVASGSMLAEIIKGKSLEEVKKIAEVIKSMLKGKESRNELELGDLEALKGVRKFPVRIKCALLSWTTLIDAILAKEASKKAQISSSE